MKRFLSLLLTLCLVFSLMPAALADGGAKSDDIVILYTNDVHTYIDNQVLSDPTDKKSEKVNGLSYASVASLKKGLQEDYNTVLLMDAGDHIQGTAYGSMDKGETIIELMNAAGYDAAALGNHEFDYGMERCLELVDKAEYPYLSCNFYHEESGVKGESVLDAYKLFDANGKKVAIIGITTPESFTKSTPAYFQDENGNYIYGIAGGTDGSELYDAVQSAIDAASKEADYVIALGHLGNDPASKPWTSEEVIANTTGLDAFIDGHSHSTVLGKEVTDKGGNTVVLTQTGQYLGAIGKLVIDVDAEENSISTSLIDFYKFRDDEYVDDAAVSEIQNEWIKEITNQLGVVIGYADVTFDNYDADGKRLVRKQETNTGDFAADALYYLFDNMDLDVDVAIMNGGGVRNTAVTGDLSYLSCKSIHTFGNVACLQTITGQQLLDALEWGARDVGNAECGGFLQVSGLTYEIHTYIDSTVQKDDKGVWVGGPTDKYRVKNVQILNKETGMYEPLDLTAKYNLAGYNYTLRDLGDGFAMFDGAVNVLDYVMEDYMVLANYVKSFPVDEATGLPTITAENSPYGEVTGEGRIKLISEGPAATIFYTNDVHTYIDGDLQYSTVASLVDEYEAMYGDDAVLLVDAGDHAQGTAYGSMDKGKTILELMNAAGYDAATLGNHEFDYGMDGRINITDNWAKFPYLSCNFYHEANGVKGEPVLDAYKLFTANGKTIAIIGITTPESFTKSTPAYFQDENGNYIYGIAGGEEGSELYAAVQDAIDAADAAGADYIIALGHLGIDTSSQPWTSEDVIANTTGLDAFIDGHSHSTVEGKEVADKAGNTVVLTQTGSYLDAIGKLTIAADGTISTELITNYGGRNADVAAKESAWIASVDEQLGTVIGYADVTFNNYDADGKRLVRKQETNTGDFAADALYYLFDNMDLDVDVAIMNGGGVRNKAVTGELTYKSCKSIHTFGNVACLQTITGQQLLDALEWGARDVGTAECGGFLQVSGLTYEIHTYIDSTVQKDAKGVWAGGPTSEYRVKNVQILNKETGKYEPLDLTAKYNLAGYNYTLRDLGDGFAMFDGAVNVLDYVMEDYMVLANYVKSFPEINGLPTITADNSPYGEVTGEGRIQIVDEEPEVPFPTQPYQPAQPTVTYTDIRGHWAADAIEYVTEAGLMNGVGNGKFAPDAALSRGMLATILYRMAGEPAVSGKASAAFTDCENGTWYSDAVVWAAKNGIIKGYTDGTVLPNQSVTRQEMAVIIYRYAVQIEGAKPVTDPLTYADASSIAGWAVEGVAYCTAHKILQGSNNYFRPTATATRAEVDQVFANLSKR